MSGLTLGDVLDAQAKYRAELPDMVDRETVIRLIFQAVDDATIDADKALDRLGEQVSELGLKIARLTGALDATSGRRSA